MTKFNLKGLFVFLGPALLICSVVVLALIGSMVINATLTSQIGSVISGIWAGVAFTFISTPILKLDPSWSFGQRQNYLNRIYFIHIVLGGAIFFIGGIFGSGIVFGIDLIGMCKFGSLLTVLGNYVHGNILIITLIGAGFGLYMSVIIWFDRGIKTPTTLGNIILVGAGIPFILFSFAFSSVLATPFIFTAFIIRLLSSTVLHKFLYTHSLFFSQKVLIIISIFLLPFIAYISRITMFCPV